MFSKRKSAYPQVSPLQKWHTYPQHRSAYKPSPVSHELHLLQGPVTYVNSAQLPEVADIMPPLPQTKEAVGSPTEDTWYTDGRCQGNLPIRRSSAIQLDSNVLWFEEELNKVVSGQS